MKRVIYSLLVALLVATSATVAQSRKYPPIIADAREEVYKTIDDFQLKLWIFDPPNHQATDRRPAIVFFFGGGWTSGSPVQFESQCRYLASQGMVAITSDYRVRSRNDTPAIKCVEDGKSAVRWIRANADRLGVDPNRIVAGGGSAGGHVAACTGIVPGLDAEDETAEISSVPNALALFNPAMVLAPIEGVDGSASRLEAMKERAGVDPKVISPIHHVHGNLLPTIIFHGDKDTTVPYSSVQLYTRLAKAAGSECVLATYEGYGHGFFNPGPDEANPSEAYRMTLRRLHQFLQSLGYLSNDPAIPKSKHVQLRSQLDNCRTKFEQSNLGTVAFIGGSITEMDHHGHTGMVEKFLQRRFPKTEFKFVNAGIASTCSTTGSFRLTRDVLRHNPDLLFIEFAVNDDQDAMHARRDCIRGMEGIIRQARIQNPNVDIVVTYFINDQMLQQLQNGEIPLAISAHETVARHYGVASNDLASEVAKRITDGTLTWKEYGGTHPIEKGNRIAADLMEDLLTAAWTGETRQNGEHPLPKPIDNNSYMHGKLVPLLDVTHDTNWTIDKPDWSAIAGSFRSRFAGDELLHTDKVAAEAKLRFSGTAVGMYVLAGPDAGTVEYSIDGGEYREADLFHHFSVGLHYPRTVILDADLENSEHEIVIRVSKSKNEMSQGHAIRILNFVVN